jgi:hypothetical protein
MVMAAQGEFYSSVPLFTRFTDLTDPGLYQPLPPDWSIGLADVVSSTQAIAAGRYKTVNTIGAAVIAAVTNELGRLDFPFAFGGDGAAFAVGPDHIDLARRGLAATAAWARDELSMELRVALVPIAAIRTEGRDVRVARFAPSPHVSYAMFAGGGLAWAERAMKRGDFAVPPAGPGVRPDLSGLSCRWEEIPSRRGVILSLVVVPEGSGEQAAFQDLVRDLLASVEGNEAAVSPVPEEGPRLGNPGTGLEIETRIGRKAGQPLGLARAALLVRRVLAYGVFRLNLKVGRFDPQVYKRRLAANSDFRKYDDGLRMTLDCTPGFAEATEERLKQAEAEGVARYGLHRQAAAIMTCITPSPTDDRHVHFIDGAAGGYAQAASRLKAGTMPGVTESAAIRA